MRKIIALSCLVIGLSSCYYDNKEELYPTDPTQCETVSQTYDANIKAIINQSCAVSGCHVAGAQTPMLTTYTEVKNNIVRIEQRALVTKDMPTAGPLGSCDQSKLTQWIADGYPEK